MNTLSADVDVLAPDSTFLPAVALRLDFAHYKAEVPVHAHRKAQLVLALHGAVTCKAAGHIWIAPPNCGIWIPGGIPHSNRATSNAQLTYLFVEPGAHPLPSDCCILAISPLLREMIHWLAACDIPYENGSHPGRLVRVLLEELATMPRQSYGLSVADNPKIALIAEGLIADPADRRTVGEWARHLAMSERSLTRLFLAQTGLTFGRWRQQLHLLHALRELAGGASVQAVSLDLGYSSVTAFITMFRKAVGVSPSRYVSRDRQT